jgi:hypothetical protein
MHTSCGETQGGASLVPNAMANKRVVYDLLFRAAAATLLHVAANPKRLGAANGGLMVLHTWGQRLHIGTLRMLAPHN